MTWSESESVPESSVGAESGAAELGTGVLLRRGDGARFGWPAVVGFDELGGRQEFIGHFFRDGSRGVFAQPWQDSISQLFGIFDVGEVTCAFEEDVVRAEHGVDERVGPIDGDRVQF